MWGTICWVAFCKIPDCQPHVRRQWCFEDHFSRLLLVTVRLVIMTFRTVTNDDCHEPCITICGGQRKTASRRSDRTNTAAAEWVDLTGHTPCDYPPSSVRSLSSILTTVLLVSLFIYGAGRSNAGDRYRWSGYGPYHTRAWRISCAFGSQAASNWASIDSWSLTMVRRVVDPYSVRGVCSECHCRAGFPIPKLEDRVPRSRYMPCAIKDHRWRKAAGRQCYIWRWLWVLVVTCTKSDQSFEPVNVTVGNGGENACGWLIFKATNKLKRELRRYSCCFRARDRQSNIIHAVRS